MEAVSEHLTSDDKNVRQAAVTVILNYSICWLDQEDEEGRIQAISALAGAISEETDLQTLLRQATALGNLGHGNAEAKGLIETYGIQFPPDSQVKATAADFKAASNRETIKEIATFMGLL